MISLIISIFHFKQMIYTNLKNDLLINVKYFEKWKRKEHQ